MIYFLITIISLLIGYILGRLSKPEEVIRSGFETLMYKGKNIVDESIPTGIIKPKTAKDIFEKNRPQKEKEGLQAFKETLDNSPELVAHRKLVEQAKKINKEKYE